MRSVLMMVTLLVGMVMAGCMQNREQRTDQAETPVGNAVEATESMVDSMMRPNVLLVEQAVDAWLFFNLGDFKNYEPIIRSTECDSIAGTYVHHLRFRYMNDKGGLVTAQRDFKVDTNRPGENGIPYAVTPL